MATSTPAQQHAEHASASAQRAGKEATDTGSAAMKAVSEVGKACLSACTHSAHMVKDQAGNLVHECTKQCRHAAACAKNVPSKAGNWIQRHPVWTTILLLTSSVMLGMLFGTMGIGGLLAGKGLFSSFRYDTFSYPKGSSESHAHMMLDRMIQSRQQPSMFGRMMPSSAQDLTHYLQQLTTGKQQTQISSQDIQKILQQVMGQTHPSSFYEKLPGLSSWLPGHKEQQEWTPSSIMGGGEWNQQQQQQQQQPSKGGMFSSIFGGGKPQQESEQEQLKRLLQEASRKAQYTL